MHIGAVLGFSAHSDLSPLWRSFYSAIMCLRPDWLPSLRTGKRPLPHMSHVTKLWAKNSPITSDLLWAFLKINLEGTINLHIISCSRNRRLLWKSREYNFSSLWLSSFYLFFSCVVAFLVWTSTSSTLNDFHTLWKLKKKAPKSLLLFFSVTSF